MAKSRLEWARALCERAKALARKARRAEAELAAALLEIERAGAHHALGYPRIQEFAEAELDMSGGKAKELVELGRGLERLPKARAAFASGEVSWTKCRQVVRIASPENEDAWLARAAVLTNRGLERAVAAAKGERPKTRIVIELTEEQAADLERAVARIREERGEAIPLADAVAEIARRSLGAPVARPGYEIVIQECGTCGAASRDARDGPAPVDGATLAAAHEDAEIVDLRAPDAPRRNTIAPAVRAKVIARDGNRCRSCGAPAWSHIHHTVPGRGDLDSLILLCSTCHKRLVHRGDLVIAPSGGGRFEFRLRDGSAAPGRRRSAG